MIEKIQNSEYLKRFDNMAAGEKEDYLSRVGEWLERLAPMLKRKAEEDMARFQNALQCSASWNDEECTAWNEGARLLSALAATSETWLPDMLYVKSARRAIMQMTMVIAGVFGEKVPGKKAKEDRQEGTAKATDGVAPFPEGSSHGDIGKGDGHAEGKAKPEVVRPRHIDQYIHLLPKKTQEKAATVQGLLRELDMARENARRLMDAGEHSDKVAQWAKSATSLDNKLNAIYREIDSEWDKLVREGRVTVDDLGNAHVVEEKGEEQKQDTKAEPKGKAGRPQMTDEEKAMKKKEKEAQKAAENQKKAALLRKWLIDLRNAKGEEQQKKWEAKYKEMVKLGGLQAVTDKVRQAAEYYGVDFEKIKI